jgi:hypothetical protein
MLTSGLAGRLTERAASVGDEPRGLVPLPMRALTVSMDPSSLE